MAFFKKNLQEKRKVSGRLLSGVPVGFDGQKAEEA
jgi:hypothetical protein